MMDLKTLIEKAFEILENLDGNTVVVTSLFAVSVLTITWKYYQPHDHFAQLRKQKHVSANKEIEKALSKVLKAVLICIYV